MINMGAFGDPIAPLFEEPDEGKPHVRFEVAGDGNQTR
jgi:hypothetical protein